MLIYLLVGLCSDVPVLGLLDKQENSDPGGAGPAGGSMAGYVSESSWVVVGGQTPGSESGVCLGMPQPTCVDVRAPSGSYAQEHLSITGLDYSCLSVVPFSSHLGPPCRSSGGFANLR